ncbi:MAG: uroporphyrinogen decarboxylase family protein [Armatimonadota bacterium]
MPVSINISEIYKAVEDRSPVWDSLWAGESIGRIAVGITPGTDRLSRIRETAVFDLDRSTPKPEYWTDEWDQALVDQLCDIKARTELPGDFCPALYVPRFVHGQSQGITDIFGAKVEAQPDGNYFTFPLTPDPAFIDNLEIKPLESSIYWGAVVWLKYARASTGGYLPFCNPVMTGPIDTANYLLGSTVLLEWIYTEPETVHSLLDKVTDVIIRMVHALRSAAGGTPHTLHCRCTRGGFDLCSEVRSIISRSVYEEFEAPYLQKIGDACGPFGIHSCGSWERTIPSVLMNPHIRAMNGQIKENDLRTLCDEVSGRILLSIGPSVNVHSRYTWLDMESFYRHILETVPDDQPFEVILPEDDLNLWNKLHLEIRGKESGLS